MPSFTHKMKLALLSIILSACSGDNKCNDTSAVCDHIVYDGKYYNLESNPDDITEEILFEELGKKGYEPIEKEKTFRQKLQAFIENKDEEELKTSIKNATTLYENGPQIDWNKVRHSIYEKKNQELEFTADREDEKLYLEYKLKLKPGSNLNPIDIHSNIED